MSERKQMMTVIVDENGRVAVDFDGYEGEECLAAAKKMETELKALGVWLDLRRRDGKAALAVKSKETTRRKAKTPDKDKVSQ